MAYCSIKLAYNDNCEFVESGFNISVLVTEREAVEAASAKHRPDAERSLVAPIYISDLEVFDHLFKSLTSVECRQ
jgi:hypothetical protein